MCVCTCQTGSLCLPDFAVDLNTGVFSFSCKLYTATEPESEGRREEEERETGRKERRGEGKGKRGREKERGMDGGIQLIISYHHKIQ